ncbi:hypothetical protein AMECASPLE_028620 [Ameca splendens]|uniref:Uncharacterized protein n=1 Tax=Ameca splendens TaxID=208324 RepID=A0ABV0ZT62_9TELE
MLISGDEVIFILCLTRPECLSQKPQPWSHLTNTPGAFSKLLDRKSLFFNSRFACMKHRVVVMVIPESSGIFLSRRMDGYPQSEIVPFRFIYLKAFCTFYQVYQ